jgi:cytoskeleton protein RodZ
MKSIGEKLKKAREVKGLTINEVSVATKINPKVLSALEEGDLEKLPPKSFLRGFVRTYSMYLKLNTDEILNHFGQEMGKTVYTSSGLQAGKDSSNGDSPHPQAEAPAPAPILRIPTPKITIPKIKLPKAKGPVIESKSSDEPTEATGGGTSSIKWTPKFLIGGGVVVIIAVVFLIKGLVDKYEKEKVIDPIPTIEAPATVEEKPQPKEEVAVVATAPATTPTAPTETPAPSTEAKMPVAPENPPTIAAPKVVEPAKVEPPKVEAPKVQPPTPGSNPTTAAPAVTPPAPAPTPVAAAPTTAQQTIMVEALDKVNLAIRLGNGQTQKLTLSPDQVHTIKAAGDVFVDVSDGGAVNIIYNGKEKGVPGDLGKPIKIKFP